MEYAALLGGKCVRCGTMEGLEFDHIDRTTKKFSIGKLCTRRQSEVFEELKKCQLLCKAHHLEKSRASGDLSRVPVNKSKWRHGTTTSYMAKGCRCDECREFYKAYRRQRYVETGN